MLKLFVIRLHDERDDQADRAKQKSEREPTATAPPLIAQDDAASDSAQNPKYKYNFH
jgi:hypothetical protein